MDKLALGIDIGGTNTAFGLVDKQGLIVKHGNVPTTDFTSAYDLSNYLFEFLQNEINQNLILGIGIGAPNGNHFTGCIDNAPNLVWKGVIPLKQIFEDTFKLPTYLSNDANAAAIGEKVFGNAQDLSDFVEITLGTGLGSGIFINNELIVGKYGNAAEYGHIRVIPNGRLCGCGRKGCLETYASSTGVVRSITELSSENKDSSKLLSMENIEAKDVFEHAQQGDLFALEIINYTATILGSALADFTAFSDPQAYILFGGLSHSGSFFSDKVKLALNENLLNIYRRDIEIRNSALNNKNAAILGTSSVVFWEALNRKNI